MAVFGTYSLRSASRNHARMPHCLRWGGMASLLGGLGDRFPQHNRDLPSKAPPLAAGIFTLRPRERAYPKTPQMKICDKAGGRDETYDVRGAVGSWVDCE